MCFVNESIESYSNFGFINSEETLCIEQFTTKTRKEDKCFIYCKAINQGEEITTIW